jgi:hypothetical protein
MFMVNIFWVSLSFGKNYSNFQNNFCSITKTTKYEKSKNWQKIEFWKKRQKKLSEFILVVSVRASIMINGTKKNETERNIYKNS